MVKKNLFPYTMFPYRLEHEEGEEKRTCWFQCEEHLHEHVRRYRITKGKVDVAEGFTLKQDPLKPKAKRTKRPSGGKGSQASTTKKPISKGQKDQKVTKPRQKKGKVGFSQLDQFFGDK